MIIDCLEAHLIFVPWVVQGETLGCLSLRALSPGWSASHKWVLAVRLDTRAVGFVPSDLVRAVDQAQAGAGVGYGQSQPVGGLGGLGTELSKGQTASQVTEFGPAIRSRHKIGLLQVSGIGSGPNDIDSGVTSSTSGPGRFYTPM